MDTSHTSTGLRPGLTSVMGAIWDSCFYRRTLGSLRGRVTSATNPVSYYLAYTGAVWECDFGVRCVPARALRLWSSLDMSRQPSIFLAH